MRIKITNGAIEVRKWEEKYYYDVIIFEWEEFVKKDSSINSDIAGFANINSDDELPF
jgi:hypothetical protein